MADNIRRRYKTIIRLSAAMEVVYYNVLPYGIYYISIYPSSGRGSRGVQGQGDCVEYHSP